jgi:hypothetical protein
MNEDDAHTSYLEVHFTSPSPLTFTSASRKRRDRRHGLCLRVGQLVRPRARPGRRRRERAVRQAQPLAGAPQLGLCEMHPMQIRQAEGPLSSCALKIPANAVSLYAVYASRPSMAREMRAMYPERVSVLGRSKGRAQEQA